MSDNPHLASLAVEVTNRCNMKCRMCVSHGAELYQGQADGHPPFVDVDFFRSIVEQYRLMGPGSDKTVVPQFQGEPLLHPKFLELCRILEELDLRFSFTTNASLLSRDMSRELLKFKKFIGISFSIDGAHRETYEKIRIGANFEQVENNVRDFIKLASPRINNGFSVVVSYTEQAINEHETDAFIRKWASSISCVSINNVAVNGRPKKVDWIPNRIPCRDLWRFMIVLTNGQTVPCCRDYLYRYDMGNLSKRSLKDIWLGDQYRQMRRLHEKGGWDAFELCADCDTWMCGTEERREEQMDPNILICRGPFFRTATRKPAFLARLRKRLQAVV